MDKFSKGKRSEIMSRIRSTGTKAERLLVDMAIRIVREELGRCTRVRSHAKQLYGRPDVFVPSIRLVLFLDGCFFHKCPTHGHIPKSNIVYWRQKISGNVRRDARVRRALRREAYSVWRFWEHEVRTAPGAAGG